MLGDGGCQSKRRVANGYGGATLAHRGPVATYRDKNAGGTERLCQLHADSSPYPVVKLPTASKDDVIAVGQTPIGAGQTCSFCPFPAVNRLTAHRRSLVQLATNKRPREAFVCANHLVKGLYYVRTGRS